jgi:hypothetical protein
VSGRIGDNHDRRSTDAAARENARRGPDFVAFTARKALKGVTPKTRFVSTLDPPSNHPVPTPNAINRSPARSPRVPNTCKTLSIFAAVIKHTSRMRLTLEIQSSTGFTRAAKSP